MRPTNKHERWRDPKGGKLMKFSDIIGSATSNMLRSKVRTLLTIIAIVIGAFTITLTVGISSGISNYLDKQVNGIGAKDVVIVQPKIEFGTSGSPTKYKPGSTVAQSNFASPTMTKADVETIAQQPGVLTASPNILVNPDYIAGPNGEKYIISTQATIDSLVLQYEAGTLPNNTSDQRQILLPASYVQPLGFSSPREAVGKTVTIAISSPLDSQNSVDAVISGVQQESIISRSSGANINKALLDALYTYQTQGLPASATDKYFAVVATFDPSNTDSLQTIKDGLAKKGFDTTTVEDQIGILKQVINAITYVLIFFGAIALLAASFGIINTLYMSVQERTKEIGLMKAMGMSRAKVFLLFSVEAILIGFWGSVIGIVAAVGAGKVANAIASDTFLKDLPGFSLTLFPVASVLIIMLVIMGIALLSGTLPARRAAKQDPIEALRYE